MNRRQLLFALGTAPLWVTGCAHREETPLAYLYGRDWVHGAYELYAGKYASLQKSSEDSSQQAYAVLAQKGVTALDALCEHSALEVIECSAIVRHTPDRLTFTADMTDADRKAAQARWEKARENIQTDYEEIRRLDWALTTLLAQMQRVRSAIDAGRIEQYKLVRRLGTLTAGDKPPFDLPYQVPLEDYRDVLTLLVERLDDDGKRLQRLESDIVTVGLTARATDAGSGSLAANLHKVLLAVITDAQGSAPRLPTFPALDADRARLLAQGKELCASIQTTPEYVAWEKRERTRAFDQVGMLLQTIDAMTGLHVSVVYQQALDIWRGDADYLSYLKTIARMLPGGSHVTAVVEQAILLTDRARKMAGQVQGGLLNLGSDFARGKLGKQLAFFKNQREMDQIKGLVGDSGLMKGALPDLPSL